MLYVLIRIASSMLFWWEHLTYHYFIEDPIETYIVPICLLACGYDQHSVAQIAHN